MNRIKIKGTIVSNDDKKIYDWCEIEAVCPREIEEALEKSSTEDITVEINSGGGDVFAGNEIYYLLNSYKGKVTVDVSGLAASAATVIAMGADKIRMVPSGLFMIHNVSSSASGDYRVMDEASGVLKTANKAICSAYKHKTGLSEKKLLELMNEEKFMTAEEAKYLGFIDEIIEPQNIKIYNGRFANILGERTKQKISDIIKEPDVRKRYSDFLCPNLVANLEILRMRGKVL